MVGGAVGSFIGNVHRRGAQLDDLAILTVGCFSRNDERNRETATAYHLNVDRLYTDYRQMADKESCRPDGIDFVIIATPNVTHFPIAKCFSEHGIHVSCDKPVAMNIEEALQLQEIATRRNLHFGVSYTYVNYPMVHQMRYLIEQGEIGRILTVMAEYPQNWVINDLDAGKDIQHKWRFDPKQAGSSAAAADIGTHLVCLIQRATGLKIEKVLANLSCIPSDLPLDTNAQVLLTLSDGVPGMLWASQIAVGHECSVSLRVFGDKGALEWSHDRPTRLRFTRVNNPEIWLTDGRSFLAPEIQKMSRIAAGHPEGYYEAFGNYYRAFCYDILREHGEVSAPSLSYLTIEDGIDSMRFIDACINSNSNGNIWVALKK